MFTRKQFIKYMKEYKQLDKDIDGMDDAMKKISPDFGGFHLGRVNTMVVDLLRETMEDTSEWIEYFIYDIEWGKNAKKGTVTDKNGKDIPIKTLSNLYDIIINKDIA